MCLCFYVDKILEVYKLGLYFVAYIKKIMRNKLCVCIIQRRVLMKIKTIVKYYEGYLPTKRHRKLRYRLIEEEVELTLNSASKDEAPIAFLVDDCGAKTEFRLWNNELWKKVYYSEMVSGASGLWPLEDFIKFINYRSYHNCSKKVLPHQIALM